MEWDEVVRVTEGITRKEDDVTLNILTYRGLAMTELGTTEATLALMKE